ncbi:MAG: phage tail protein [Bacteroidales bacterium]|nr:phage tail protein [Bacteroidales bacterium]
MDPFLGQVQAFGFNYAPVGWMLCQGQILNISTNNALFALLSTTFGGNGISTFGLPDLRGRTIVNVGQATGLSLVTWGLMEGAESKTLNTSNMPVHNHNIANGDGVTPGTAKVTTVVTTTSSDSASNESDNGNNGLGTSGAMLQIYRESPSGNDRIGGVASIITGSTALSGGNTAVNIRNPYLGLNYSIATTGIFPSRG